MNIYIVELLESLTPTVAKVLRTYRVSAYTCTGALNEVLGFHNKALCDTITSDDPSVSLEYEVGNDCTYIVTLDTTDLN